MTDPQHLATPVSEHRGQKEEEGQERGCTNSCRDQGSTAAWAPGRGPMGSARTLSFGPHCDLMKRDVTVSILLQET